MKYRKVVERIGHPLLMIISNTLNKITFYLNGIKLEKSISTRGILYVRNYGEINIGSNVTINSATWANPVGGGNKTCIQVLPEGKLIIGNNTGISNCFITCAQSVSIGNNVMIGSGCRIFDTDFHPLESGDRRYNLNEKIKIKEVLIEDDVFIGTSSIVLKGSHIGKGAVIGAGSIVSGNIPPYQIWAGNPAKFIKNIS